MYIHAARGTDDRPDGWAHVSDDLRPLADRTGGLIGTAELAACVQYRTAPGFAAEANRHLNAADWFVPPRMYGFEFRNPSVIPFIAYKGSVRFFTIDLPEPA